MVRPFYQETGSQSLCKYSFILVAVETRIRNQNKEKKKGNSEFRLAKPRHESGATKNKRKGVRAQDRKVKEKKSKGERKQDYTAYASLPRQHNQPSFRLFLVLPAASCRKYPDIRRM
jgi:hypothetical protein